MFAEVMVGIIAGLYKNVSFSFSESLGVKAVSKCSEKPTRFDWGEKKIYKFETRVTSQHVFHYIQFQIGPQI